MATREMQSDIMSYFVQTERTKDKGGRESLYCSPHFYILHWKNSNSSSSQNKYMSLSMLPLWNVEEERGEKEIFNFPIK